MSEYKVQVETGISAEDVISARGEQLTDENIRIWRKCLEQSLCVAGARNAEGALVGVCFLIGNARHGEIVDLAVRSDCRGYGVGRKLFDTIAGEARGMGIRYLGLTYDTKSPWLKGFYERHGFRSIDFAMWDSDSLSNLGV